MLQISKSFITKRTNRISNDRQVIFGQVLHTFLQIHKTGYGPEYWSVFCSNSKTFNRMNLCKLDMEVHYYSNHVQRIHSGESNFIYISVPATSIFKPGEILFFTAWLQIFREFVLI